MLRCNMTHTWLSVLTISVLIVLNLGQENVPRNGELRAMLRQCKNTTSSSETISECVIKGLDVLRDIFEFGDIDVNLPSIDPQPLLDVHIQEGTTGQVNMNCLCTNVTLMGTSEYEFTELKIDYTAKTLYLRFLLPKVRMNSLYKLSGNIWIIPITGEGTSWIKLVRAMLRQCKNTTSSPESISECVIKGLDVVRDIFEFGDININLASMDPQPMDTMSFREGQNGQVNVDAVFNNVNLLGISDYQVQELKIDYKAKTLRLRFRLPEVRLNSLYKLTGTVLIIPITGEGTSWTKLDDVDVVIETNMEIDGNTIHFNYTNFDFTYGKVNLRMNNLFDSDPVLGATMNMFVNENSKEIIDDMKPDIRKQMFVIFEKLQNQVFATLSTEDIPGIEQML